METTQLWGKRFVTHEKGRTERKHVDRYKKARKVK